MNWETLITTSIYSVFSGLSTALEKVAELNNKYGQEAVNLALNVVRINAAQSLFIGFISLVIATVTTRTLYKIRWDCFDVLDIQHLLCLIATIFAATIAIFGLLNVWNWVGFIYPELWVAKQALLVVGDSAASLMKGK